MHRFDQLQLYTPRLILRPLQTTDAAALFTMCSDVRVMRYWSTPPWVSHDEAHKLIARDQRAMATGEYLCLGLERQSDQALLGQCTLFKLDRQCRRAELGYCMAHQYWHQGYMREALTALLDYGFPELSLNRVEADTDPRNHASIRQLEALGFQHEGVLRQRWIVNGEIQDASIYGLLAREWSQRQPGE